VTRRMVLCPYVAAVVAVETCLLLELFWVLGPSFILYTAEDARVHSVGLPGEPAGVLGDDKQYSSFCKYWASLLFLALFSRLRFLFSVWPSRPFGRGTMPPAALPGQKAALPAGRNMLRWATRRFSCPCHRCLFFCLCCPRRTCHRRTAVEHGLVGVCERHAAAAAGRWNSTGGWRDAGYISTVTVNSPWNEGYSSLPARPPVPPALPFCLVNSGAVGGSGYWCGAVEASVMPFCCSMTTVPEGYLV